MHLQCAPVKRLIASSRASFMEENLLLPLIQNAQHDTRLF